MKEGFSRTEKRLWKNRKDNEEFSIGNLDLINLRLNLPTGLKNKEESPRAKFIGGSGDSSFRSNCRYNAYSTVVPHQESPKQYSRQAYALPKPKHLSVKSSDDVVLLYSSKEAETPHRPVSKVITTEPISKNDFLYPTKKKNSQKTVDVIIEKGGSIQNRVNQQFKNPGIDESRSFPFKRTPSGNLKIESSQVVFASKKLSVLVADPKNTRINFNGNNLPKKMAQDTFDALDKSSPMQTIMNQPGGFSSLNSIIANTPVRTKVKEAAEYENKPIHEILQPELDLGRMGYNGHDQIDWDKVVLPEKENLYIQLYSRITKNTNADCKVYIDNEEFNCHLIVLQVYSELFDNHMAVKKAEVPSDKCSVASFSFIYKWMISGEPSYIDLTRNNVLDIFNAAKYLKIGALVEQCWAFIDNTEVFNEDSAFLLYMDAKKKNLPEVKELMLPRIQDFFLMLVSSQDWLELDVEDIENFLKSNYVKVNCEMEIFMSAVRWLRHDWQTRDSHKYDVLECVRFGNLQPWQLVDIKRNSENPDFMELAKDLKICKMIDDGLAYVIVAGWYGKENEEFGNWTQALNLQPPQARNWRGGDILHYTYREFLIYLDQYRRINLMEKRKPGLLDKNTKIIHSAKDNENKAHEISPTPREAKIPTMDEFMTKKNNPKKVNKVVS